MHDDFDDVRDWHDEDDDGSNFHGKGYTKRRSSVLGVPERQQRKTWNGTPIDSMDSEHIMNSILFCERKFAEARTNFVTCFGTGTEDDFYFLNVFEMFPDYTNLRNEWKKRKGN